ncbi:MAG: hydrogenase maturation protease [Bacillota bacterium]
MSSDKAEKLILGLKAKKVLFIGLGNPWRGDDGAGLFLVDLLEKKLPQKNFFYLKADENPENFLGEIRRIMPEVVLLFDSAALGKPGGEIDVLAEGSISNGCISTHTYSLSIFTAYLKSAFKCDVYIIGIQGETYGLSDGILQISRNLRKRLAAFASKLQKQLELKPCAVKQREKKG